MDPEDADITEAEIIADILKYSAAPQIQPHDIDYDKIMTVAACSYSTAGRIGKQMVASGKYERTKAYCPERRREVVVFRKLN